MKHWSRNDGLGMENKIKEMEALLSSYNNSFSLLIQELINNIAKGHGGLSSRITHSTIDLNS